MALPADVREQLAEREARLRVVSVGEVPPPAAVRDHVQRRQEHVHEVAGTIRWADGTVLTSWLAFVALVRLSLSWRKRSCPSFVSP